METVEQGAAAADVIRDDIIGLIRRVRRLARWSQRELAGALGVSQSAVAKWETGRTAPSARMLARVLDLAELSLVAVTQDGERVRPMRAGAARDAAGRRYPAHASVWVEGWWAPEGAGMTAWLGQILCRSEDLGLPLVRYGRGSLLGRASSLADLDDHPTWRELVAEAQVGWRPARRQRVLIPEWAYADTHKSRNRRPEDFRRAAARREHASGRGWRAPVETPRETGHLRQ